MNSCVIEEDKLEHFLNLDKQTGAMYRNMAKLEYLSEAVRQLPKNTELVRKIEDEGCFDQVD